MIRDYLLQLKRRCPPTLAAQVDMSLVSSLQVADLQSPKGEALVQRCCHQFPRITCRASHAACNSCAVLPHAAGQACRCLRRAFSSEHMEVRYGWVAGNADTGCNGLRLCPKLLRLYSRWLRCIWAACSHRAPTARLSPFLSFRTSAAVRADSWHRALLHSMASCRFFDGCCG